MGAGTGGTIAGVATFLHDRDESVRVYLVDPPGSALYHAVRSGVCFAPEQTERRIQRNRYDTITEGIGLDRLTTNFRRALPHVTEAYKGTDQEAVSFSDALLLRF